LDDSDKATQREEQDREVCMKYNRKPELYFIGSCYNCSEPIARGVYCSAACRDDDEQRRRFRNGR
jgi:hypothetical protein